MIFDRSWYNRAGVEYVMGFCTPEQHKRFLALCPQIEKYIVEGGIILIKVWLEVGMEEQEKRFAARIDDPLRQWKLSPMDVQSFDTLVRLFQGARPDVQGNQFKARSVVRHPLRRQTQRRLNCISHRAEIDPVTSA